MWGESKERWDVGRAIDASGLEEITYSMGPAVIISAVISS